MKSFSELSNVKQADAPGGSFLIRWRGKQEGPYLESVINNKLSSNEISLIHEIFYESRWMSIRDYLSKKDAALKILNERQQQRSKPKNSVNFGSKVSNSFLKKTSDTTSWAVIDHNLGNSLDRNTTST